MNLTAPAFFKVSMKTSQGTVVIEVQRDWAPLAADRFYSLAKNGFFDNCRFFRVMPNFIAQWGIHGRPKVAQVWADAGIRDEPSVEPNAKGTVAFAKAEAPNTRATQIFINLKDNGPSLDPQGFAPFGRVIEGMDVVGKLYTGYGDRHGPSQDRLIRDGNSYLSAEFPMLDYIAKAVVIED